MHLIWHRADLRTHDHPALHGALEQHKSDNGGILPLVIIDEAIFARADLTSRRRAWFLENVAALRESYRKAGCDLMVRFGEPAQVLAKLAEQLRKNGQTLQSAHYIRNYTPYAKKRDDEARRVLQTACVEVFDYAGQYTHEPGEVLTNEGKRYSVYGPFLKKWNTLPKPQILPRLRQLPPLLSTLPVGKIPLVESDIQLPLAGEEAAKRRLDWFLQNIEADYQDLRQIPALENGSSKLSYYFNIGVLSPRLAQSKATNSKWQFELPWWDFFADVLEVHPESATTEAVVAWRDFPWRHDENEFSQWQRGETGFPLVDAGMRELNATGFMHNRVRMTTADFLTRHLLIDWRWGEEYFRGQLLCGDRAQNVGNWQWVAGCGISAKPYFRVGNPVSVSKNADSAGDYIRRWIPELRELPNSVIHEPWLFANPPQNYPLPMVNLKETRARYLETAKTHLQKRKND